MKKIFLFISLLLSVISFSQEIQTGVGNKASDSTVWNGFQRHLNTPTTVSMTSKFVVVRDSRGVEYKIDQSNLTVPVTGISAGVYTPTLTNVANLDASTSHVFQYLSINDISSGYQVITVSGYVTVDPTTLNTDTQLRLSLPLTSGNFTGIEQCGGTAVAPAIASEAAAIRAEVSTVTIIMQWKPVDVTNHTMFVHFTYWVLPA